MVEALKKRQDEIDKLEQMAIQKGIDVQALKYKATSTVFDYKSLLLNALEGQKAQDLIVKYLHNQWQ